MCQAVASEVLKLTESASPPVMKRAEIAAARVVRRVPDLAEAFEPAVNRLLKHGAHGVVIAAINLMATAIAVQPSLRPAWFRYAKPFPWIFVL
jgi:AP-1 complex subunit gamma-1